MEVLFVEINDDIILKWWYKLKGNFIVFYALNNLPRKYSNIISGTNHYFHFDEYQKLSENDKIKFVDCVLQKIVKEMDAFVEKFVDLCTSVEHLNDIDKKLGRPRKFETEQIIQIKEMYEDGFMSMQDIANQMNCSKATISRCLKLDYSPKRKPKAPTHKEMLQCFYEHPPITLPKRHK